MYFFIVATIVVFETCSGFYASLQTRQAGLEESVILKQLTLCPGVENLQRVKLITECLHLIMELGHFKNIYNTILYSHTGLCCLHSPCS